MINTNNYPMCTQSRSLAPSCCQRHRLSKKTRLSTDRTEIKNDCLRTFLASKQSTLTMTCATLKHVAKAFGLIQYFVNSKLYIYYRTRRDGSSFTWHQLCNNQTALHGTPLRCICKTLYKDLAIHLESHATRAQ